MKPINELDSSATIQELIAEPLEHLKVKVLEMLRANTDPKWHVELTKLKTVLIQAEDMANTIHKKLGNIPLPSGMYESNLHEAASQEAYLLHRMTNCGQDAAQNFIDSNPNVNIKQLLKDLTQDKAYRYIVKDIVSGVADPVYKKQFAKKYGELTESVTGYALHLLPLMGAAITQAIAGGYVPNPIQWVINTFRKAKMNSVANRLSSDPDIQAFFKLSKNQQKGQWQKLLKNKLKDDEVKYVYQMSRDLVKSKLKNNDISEANNPVTELVESVVSQTILEAFEPVKYDPNIHKTVEQGAMDFTLMPDNKHVEVTMPFKEEPEVQVAVTVDKSYFDNMAKNGSIESQDDLDNLDYRSAYRDIHDLFKRPDLYKKYVDLH